MTDLNTLPSAPTLTCGYCRVERRVSSCDCAASRAVRATRAAELDGRLVAERQGVASLNVGTAGGPMTRVNFRYGADR